MIRINDFPIDAALSEDHTLDSEVTSFPVERGAEITDHVRPLPRTITIEGVVSDTPLGLAAIAREDRAVIASADETLADRVLPSIEAFTFLERVYEARQPVTITTSLRVYENMVMESLSIPRTATTGDALRFTATFRQIRIVDVRRSRVRVAAPRGSGKRRRGRSGVDPFAGPPTYWCLAYKSVYVKPQHVADAVATGSSRRPDVWTDYRTTPSLAGAAAQNEGRYAEGEYTEAVTVCVEKARVLHVPTADGGKFGLEGKPGLLRQDQIDAMNADLERQAGISDIADPVDAKSGRAVKFVDRPYVDRSPTAPVEPPRTSNFPQPWWQDPYNEDQPAILQRAPDPGPAIPSADSMGMRF